MLVFNLTKYPLPPNQENRPSIPWKVGFMRPEKIPPKQQFLFWSELTWIRKKSIIEYDVVVKCQDKRHSNGWRRKTLPSISRLPPKPMWMWLRPSKKWRNRFSWTPLASTNNIRPNLSSRCPTPWKSTRKEIQKCLVVEWVIFFYIDKGIQICGSSVGFCDSSTSTWSAIFLGLTSSWVGNQQGSIVLEKSLYIRRKPYP